jgi:PAS domain S-box-containing protein
MQSATSLPPTAAPHVRWLLDHGLRELEVLFRAIVYHPSAPVLITDNEGNSRDASIGAGKLLGVSRDKIIGRPVDDFAEPAFSPGFRSFGGRCKSMKSRQARFK